MAVLKIPFFRLGQWKHPKYGIIKGTPEKFTQFIKNYKSNVLGREPFIRIGHDACKSVFGDAEAKAWVKDIKVEGDVIYAFAEATDPEIEEAIKSKRYRFASAEYEDNYISKQNGANVGTVLTAIALTNEPFLTNLPDNKVLADNPEEFYLDFSEEEKGIMDEVLKKISDFFTELMTRFKAAEEEKPKENPEADDQGKQNENVEKLLSEFEGMKKLLSDMQATNTNIMKEKENAEIEVKLSELRSQGVPPVLIDKAKLILLANCSAETIKLSDTEEKKLSDMVLELLNSVPESARVDYIQKGAQHNHRPGETPKSGEEIKKLADEDVKALGGRIDEHGRYIL